MSANFAALLYLVSGILFVLALRGLSHPASSRQGNLFGMIGMAIAVATTLLYALPSGIMSWLLGQGARLTLAGLILGIVSAVGATRVLSALLFGVGALDAVTFAGVAVVLAGASLVACWLPALRARAVDPVVSLRSE